MMPLQQHFIPNIRAKDLILYNKLLHRQSVKKHIIYSGLLQIPKTRGCHSIEPISILRPAAGLPSSCADHTGFLYKAALNHSDGLFTEIPILGCVADMQVVLGWDMDEDGVVDTYSDADGATVSGGSAADVQNLINNANLTADNAATFRKRLKIVKVYFLVQDGKIDPNYTNAIPIVVGNQALGEASLTKNWTVAAINANNWTNYRWKVYRIVVSPKNLNLN
jgi:hypothetical protein